LERRTCVCVFFSLSPFGCFCTALSCICGMSHIILDFFFFLSI
jgi:hypothetical protein